MSVRNFATGLWNGIKKGPTHHTDGYFAAAGTTVGSAILGGIFGGAEGAMMATAATFAAGSFLAPHVNKALDKRSAIKQAISRYGPKKLLVEGGIEGAKAAGEYVIGGNRKVVGRLQKIKDSFSS